MTTRPTGLVPCTNCVADHADPPTLVQQGRLCRNHFARRNLESERLPAGHAGQVKAAPTTNPSRSSTR